MSAGLYNFNNKTENVSKQELLIFLTPTIVRSAT